MSNEATPANVGSNDGLGVWHYVGAPEPGCDSRCLVTLHEGGMEWVGIRAYNHSSGGWLNGGEPERARVHAWMPLPTPATGYWDRGRLKDNKKRRAIERDIAKNADYLAG